MQTLQKLHHNFIPPIMVRGLIRTNGSVNHRYMRLDELRGLTLISMMLYHFLWDLVYIAEIKINWYPEMPGYIWQQSICRTFILLSGFCWSFGKHPFKRGITVFLSGGLVTVVTLLFMPENRIVFGVLTLLGSCMLLWIPVDRIFSRIQNRFLWIACLIVSLVLFELLLGIHSGCLILRIPGISSPLYLDLPEWLYANYFTAYLGFPMHGFYSADYFPLFPWLFLFSAGYFLHRFVFAGTLQFTAIRRFLRTRTIPCMDLLGRHSLLIYLLHQPVLYVITLLIMRLS